MHFSEAHPLIELMNILEPARVTNLLVFHVVVADSEVAIGSILELRIENSTCCVKPRD